MPSSDEDNEGVVKLTVSVIARTSTASISDIKAVIPSALSLDKVVTLMVNSKSEWVVGVNFNPDN